MDNNGQNQAGAPNNEEQPQGYQFGDLSRGMAGACSRWAAEQTRQPGAPYQFGDFSRAVAGTVASGIAGALEQVANASAATAAAAHTALTEAARQSEIAGAAVGAQMVQNGAERAGVAGSQPANAACTAARNVSEQLGAEQPQPRPYQFGDITCGFFRGAQTAVTAGASAAIGQAPGAVNNNAPR